MKNLRYKVSVLNSEYEFHKEQLLDTIQYISSVDLNKIEPESCLFLLNKLRIQTNNLNLIKKECDELLSN